VVGAGRGGPMVGRSGRRSGDPRTTVPAVLHGACIRCTRSMQWVLVAVECGGAGAPSRSPAHKSVPGERSPVVEGGTCTQTEEYPTRVQTECEPSKCGAITQKKRGVRTASVHVCEGGERTTGPSESNCFHPYQSCVPTGGSSLHISWSQRSAIQLSLQTYSTVQ
jgi:hypothetical protein